MLQKIHSFFFRELQLITVLRCVSYMCGSTRFVSLKVHVKFSIFDSISFLLKFIFLFNKKHRLITLFKIKIITHSFVPRPLIFKLTQEVLKFSDIWLSWSFPKANLKINFVNLENQSFENISFSQ